MVALMFPRCSERNALAASCEATLIIVRSASRCYNARAASSGVGYVTVSSNRFNSLEVTNLYSMVTSRPIDKPSFVRVLREAPDDAENSNFCTVFG